MANEMARYKALLTRHADAIRVRARMDEIGARQLFQCQSEPAIMFSTDDEKVLAGVRHVSGVKEVEQAGGVVPCVAYA